MDLAYILPNTSGLTMNQDQASTSTPMSFMVPYLCVISLATVSGTVGNVLVIGAVLIKKRLRKVGNMIIVNLAIADICITAAVDPFSIVGMLSGSTWLSNVPGLCDVLATLCLMSCACSLLSIGAISFNRYIHICHDRYYTKIYSTRNTLLMCVGLWVVGVFIDLPTYLGWGGHAFDQEARACVWDRTSHLSYSIFITCIGIVLPVFMISLCYVRIFLYVQRQQKLFALQGFKKGKKESLKLAKTLFVIFVVFVCCWTLYAVLIIADVNNTFPAWIHLYALLLAHGNSSINYIIYGLQDKNFRDGYKRLLGIDKCARVNNKVHPNDSTLDSQSIRSIEVTKNENMSEI